MYNPFSAGPSKSGAVLVYMMITGAMFIVLSACSEESSESQSTNAMSASQSEDQGDDENNKLPGKFPSNVPLYEPNDIKNVSTNTSAGGTQYVAGFITEGTEQDVVDFYNKELDANGWSIMFDDGNGRFAASNGTMNISVNVTDAGRHSTIFTVTAPKQ